MTSQIPFTPLTPEAVERLTLDEFLAFEAATCAVAGDQKPSLEVVASLVLTVQRLITSPAPAERSGTATGPAEDVRARLEAALDESIDGCPRCKVCDTQIGAAMTVLGPLLERAEAAEAKLAAIAEHRNAACAALRIAETQARYPAGDEATAERYRAAREALEGTDGKETGRG